MSPYPDAPEPGSRLLLLVVLVAVGIIVAGLFSIRAGQPSQGRAAGSVPATVERAIAP